MNPLQIFFKTEARKFLLSGFGQLFRVITLYPGIAFLIAGILSWLSGAVFDQNTTRTTWTMFFVAALFFALRSAYIRGFLFGLLVFGKDLLVAKLNGQPAPVYGEQDSTDQKNTESPAPVSASTPGPKKPSFSSRLLSFVDPVRAAFNSFEFDADSREFKLLKRLEDEWFYISTQGGLSAELRPEQYTYYMSRYRARSKFFSERGFDDTTRSENLIMPSTVVNIDRLAFGIRLEIELAPGLFYDPTSNSNGGPSAQRLGADIGRIAQDIGLEFENLQLNRVPGSKNVYIDLTFKSLLHQIVSLTIPTPDSLSCKDDIFLGILEDGMPAVHNLRDNVHIITQGSTGSGKSAFTQGMLLQISCMTDVTICGIDPHSVLFSPAFDGTRHEPFMVHGSTKEDLIRYMELMENLYQEMINRLKRLPSLNVPEIKNFTPENPLLYILIDEFPGIEKNLKDQLGSAAAIRFTTLISQFLAEGRKVGFRVHVIMQQANAQNLSTQDRGNISTRITFRVEENISALMLHPEGVNVTEMVDFIAGMGFYQAPGVRPQKFRAAYYEKDPSAKDLEDMANDIQVDLAYRGYVEGIRFNCFSGYRDN